MWISFFLNPHSLPDERHHGYYSHLMQQDSFQRYGDLTVKCMFIKDCRTLSLCRCWKKRNKNKNRFRLWQRISALLDSKNWAECRYRHGNKHSLTQEKCHCFEPRDTLIPVFKQLLIVLICSLLFAVAQPGSGNKHFINWVHRVW